MGGGASCPGQGIFTPGEGGQAAQRQLHPRGGSKLPRVQDKPVHRHIRTRLEQDIVWLINPGLTSARGINLLKDQLSGLKSSYGGLSAYIFLRTCYITTKTRDFIDLNGDYRKTGLI